MDVKGGAPQGSGIVIIAEQVEGNTPPVANDDFFLISRTDGAEGGWGSVVVPVFKNDTDADGDSLRIVEISASDVASAGPFNHPNPEFTGILFVPNPTFTGTDTLTYRIHDGRGGTAEGTIFIVGVDPTNSDPVANDDFASLTDGDTSISVPVLENDTDPDEDTIQIIEVSPTSLATVEYQDATITYTPNTLFAGTDTLTYRIYDGRSGFASASIYISDSPGIAGDFDGNGKVNFGDFVMFAQAFGGTDPVFDLDGNGEVSFGDFVMFAQAFGT
jgi:hypothetical protein